MNREKDNRAMLCLDSGVSGTGWSFFEHGEIIPKDAGNIYPPVRIKNWVDRLEYIGNHVQELIYHEYPNEIDVVYAELAEFWEGHAVSRAISNNNNLAKLIACIGAFHRICVDYTDKKIEFIPVTPMEWKGQVPKEEIASRIRNIIGPIRDKAHAIDAIGIGLWARGLI